MSRLPNTRWFFAVAALALVLPGGAIVTSGLLHVAPDGADEAPDETAAAAATGFTAPVRVMNVFAFEPSVVVDDRGIVYVGLARALPNPSFVLRSEDSGATWGLLPTVPLARGAEPSIRIGPGNELYFSDLTLANTVLAKYDADGNLACFQEIAQTSGGVDRQWIVVSELGEVWMNTNDVYRGLYQYYTPDPCLVPATKPTAITLGPHVSTMPAYDAITGSVYTLYEGGQFIRSGGDGTGLLAGGLFVARTERPQDASLVGGVIPERRPVARVEGVANVFPMLETDVAGNVYAVWSETTPGRGEQIWFTWAPPGGRAWADPVRVTDGTGAHVFPWIATGANAGEVAIAWLRSADDVPAQASTGEWVVTVAKTATANAATPAFTVTDATGPMHKGGICLDGASCGVSPPWSVDRDLGDYIGVDIGPDGKVHVAYTGDLDHRTGEDTGNPRVYYVREV